jgi:hypothetical protein
MEVHFDKHHHTKKTKPFKTPGMNEFYDHFKHKLPGEIHNQIDNEVEIGELDKKIHKNKSDLSRIEYLLDNIDWHELSPHNVAVLRAAKEVKEAEIHNDHIYRRRRVKKYE